MKVLFLLGADQKYGTHRMGLSIINKMQQLHPDIKYIVITQKYGQFNEKCSQLGIENYVVPYRDCIYFPLQNSFLNFLKKTLKGILISFFHIWAEWELKKFIDLKGIDIIHSNINRDLFGCFLAKKYNKPHLMYMRELGKAHFGLNLLYSNQIDFMNKTVDKYVAVSHLVAQDWINYGIDEQKTVVSYDGVDVNEIKKADRTDHAKIKILMTGAVYPAKGQYQLVQAIENIKVKCPEIAVDIVGGIENKKYGDEINRYIQEKHLSDIVHLLPYDANIREKLSNYDIGVVCSKGEGFGLVTVEYMLGGLCPVVSDTGANLELVQNGQTGMVYEYDNISMLSDILMKLINNNSLRQQLARNAQEYAMQKFELTESINKLYSLYNNVYKNSDGK